MGPVKRVLGCSTPSSEQGFQFFGARDSATACIARTQLPSSYCWGP